MDDRVFCYAQAVVDGRLVAGKNIRQACQRHIDDLASGAERGLIWDYAAAERVFNFIEKIIVLTGGKTDGQPFKLLPWQAFVVGSVFGWKLERDGYRRFRRAYIETGKGSGKTPLIASVGLYGIVSDKEQGAEVYIAAQTADQGLVTFKQMCDFISSSSHLEHQGLEVWGGGVKPTVITYAKKRSTITRVASEKVGKGKSGVIPHMIVIDEYHEHDSSKTLDWLEAGTKNRRQPLLFITTNAGAGSASPCGLEHDKAIKVLNGTIEDDSYFSYVCGLDEGDEPFKDEDCWVKANPSLPLIPGYDYIRQQVKSCEGMPGRESVVKRLNFCKWMGSESPWLTDEVWRQCEVESVSQWGNNPVYLGLDLSRRADLTAAALVCDMGEVDGERRYEAVMNMWMPSDTVESHERDENIPYGVFAERGHLNLCQGEFIDMKMIASWITSQLKKLNISVLVYDKWGWEELYNVLMNDGAEVSMKQEHIGLQTVLISHPQGFSPGVEVKGYGRCGMPSSINALECVIRQQRLAILKNPLMRVAAEGTVVVEDGSSNRRFVKDKSRARIDPMIALTMAVGGAELINNGSGNEVQRKWDEYRSQGVCPVWTAG